MGAAGFPSSLLVQLKDICPGWQQCRHSCYSRKTQCDYVRMLHGVSGVACSMSKPATGIRLSRAPVCAESCKNHDDLVAAVSVNNSEQ